jgi:hypothetical protein
MRWIFLAMGLMVALIVVIAVIIGSSSTGPKPKHHRLRLGHPSSPSSLVMPASRDLNG